MQQQPPALERVDGVYLWDTNTGQYLDATAGIGVANISHGQEEIVRAIATQATRIPFAACKLFTSEPTLRPATETATLGSGDFNWLRFTSGGSEAVEVAIKMVRRYQTERGKLD
jgi:adenosylmethionine-8-amino-7-oxononanoate aminotransferase